MPRPRYATPSSSGADKRPDFFAEHVTVQDLAVQQGVAPACNLSDLQGEFWPDSDEVNDFAATIRQWRHEGG